LRQGFGSPGWVEIRTEYRWGGADPEKAGAFAKELIGMAPEVVVPSTN
jgi:hypothetical protein